MLKPIKSLNLKTSWQDSFEHSAQPKRELSTIKRLIINQGLLFPPWVDHLNGNPSPPSRWHQRSSSTVALPCLPALWWDPLAGFHCTDDTAKHLQPATKVSIKQKISYTHIWADIVSFLVHEIKLSYYCQLLVSSANIKKYIVLSQHNIFFGM